MGRIRLERLNSLIAETVAELILKKSKDPRLAPVTISRAEVAPNLQSARILYGVLGGDKEREAAGTALEKARGFIRSALFETLDIKRVPQIRFELDRNVAHAARVSEVLALIGAGSGAPENEAESGSEAEAETEAESETGTGAESETGPGAETGAAAPSPGKGLGALPEGKP